MGGIRMAGEGKVENELKGSITLMESKKEPFQEEPKR